MKTLMLGILAMLFLIAITPTANTEEMARKALSKEETLWNSRIQRSTALYKKGQYAQALEVAKEALETAKKIDSGQQKAGISLILPLMPQQNTATSNIRSIVFILCLFLGLKVDTVEAFAVGTMYGVGVGVYGIWQGG